MCIQLQHTCSSPLLLVVQFVWLSEDLCNVNSYTKLLWVPLFTWGWKRTLLGYDYSHPKVDFQKMSHMAAAPPDPKAWSLGWLAQL